VVVAVAGTKPARVAGGRLPRLLRCALAAIGLSALTWLVSLLVGTGTAAADTPPPGQSSPPPTTTHSSGLLGGLVGTLTNAVGGVLNTATTTAGQLTGAVLDTAGPAVPPVISPPPAASESPQPRPEPGRTDTPSVPRFSPRATIPVDGPIPVAAPAPAPSPPPAPPVVRQPAAARTEVPVVHRAEPITTERANQSVPDRSPAKLPTAPPAPAVPTSTVSSAHDGPGQARGNQGVLAATPGIQAPADAFSTRGRTGDAGDGAAGLPAASPD
jgi:hypothetical protein